MESIAETVKKILKVDHVELTFRGNPLERLKILNELMDLMQEERSRLLDQIVIDNPLESFN